MIITPNSALIPIDYQNDFSHPKGTLYVKGSELLVGTINQLIDLFHTTGAGVFATMDAHPEGHISFASRYGLQPFSEDPNHPGKLVRPDHCVDGTRGAKFVEGLNTRLFKHITRKGTEKDDMVDSYSGFAHSDLDETLRKANIKTNFLSGVATDRCVKETAMDSIKNGYETYLITDAIKAVDETTTAQVLDALQAIGVKLISSQELLQTA